MSLESFLPKSLRVSNTTRNNNEDDVNAVDCGNEVAFLATFGHFVPLPDLFNGTPFIEKVVGSESLGEDILALRDECDCKSTPGSGRSSPAARFKKRQIRLQQHDQAHPRVWSLAFERGRGTRRESVVSESGRVPDRSRTDAAEMPRQIYPA